MLKNDSDHRARDLYERFVEQERATQLQLPDALAGRLLQTPQLAAMAAGDGEELSCHEVEDRLGASNKGFGDPMLEHHLDSCDSCRRLFGPARDLAIDATPALPESLRRSLLAIPRLEATDRETSDRGETVPESNQGRSASRPRRSWRQPTARRRLSAWIHDARYAAMACYLLTAGVMWAAGDLPAHFQSARKTAGEQATAWVESGRSGGGDLTDAVASELAQRVGQGREWLRQGGAAWSRFVERTEDRLRTFPPELGEPSASADPGEQTAPATEPSTHNKNEPSSAPDPSDQGERDGTSR